MASLFQSHTQEEHAQSLANFMENGNLMIAKNIQNKNFRSLLLGFSKELERTEDYMIQTADEHDINTTQLLISEWERAVGIPDDCFPGTGSIEERRTHVLVKLASFGVSTAQDFIDLAAMLGKTIRIEYLDEVENFPPYDVPFSLVTGIPRSRFIWIVIGVDIVTLIPPLDVPFSLNTGATIIQCLFNKLKPANTIILYRNEEE